jgi:transposase-like protein
MVLLPEDTKIRLSKYMNHVIKHDHRHMKSRADVMPGFKCLWWAGITNSGSELTHRIARGSSMALNSV